MNTKYKILVEMEVEVEINRNNEIVKEYSSDNDLLSDAVSYRFSPALPLILSGGAKITFQDSDFKVIEKQTIQQ